LVPWGTESPSATTDVEEAVDLFEEDAEHPVTTQPSETRTTTAHAIPRVSISRHYLCRRLG
jgi:hypothetical protein